MPLIYGRRSENLKHSPLALEIVASRTVLNLMQVGNDGLYLSSSARDFLESTSADAW